MNLLFNASLFLFVSVCEYSYGIVTGQRWPGARLLVQGGRAFIRSWPILRSLKVRYHRRPPKQQAAFREELLQLVSSFALPRSCPCPIARLSAPPRHPPAALTRLVRWRWVTSLWSGWRTCSLLLSPRRAIFSIILDLDPNFRCFSLVEIRSAFFSRFFIYDRTDFSSETVAKRYRFCQKLLRRSSNCSVLR